MTTWLVNVRGMSRYSLLVGLVTRFKSIALSELWLCQLLLLTYTQFEHRVEAELLYVTKYPRLEHL